MRLNHHVRFARSLRCCIFRNMSVKGNSSPSTSHLQRTAANSRNEIISTATVVRIKDESKTVKSLSLKIRNDHMSFKSGQWVDMFIPGIETVGGFSMCSSPTKLQQSQVMDLAIKYSKHPPAHWVHTKCVEGSEVAVRVGGDFYYDPLTQADQDLLLVAGGVGINPLYSIINHVTDLNSKGGHSDKHAAQRVTLLYSAKTLDDLIFMDHLNQMQQADKQIQCRYHITEENIEDKSSNTFIYGRIGREDVAKCFDWLRKDHVTVYLCGPSPMLTDMEKLLIEQGIPKNKIVFEKWW